MENSRTYHIYLVSSDVLYRSMLRRFLEQKESKHPGYSWRLFTFEDLDSFSKGLSNHPAPDFIFTDILFDEAHVRYKEGLAAIEKVKAIKFNCPIYFITDKKKEQLHQMADGNIEGLLSNELDHIEEVVKTLKSKLNLESEG